jgi:hypothetical protein
MSRYDIAAGSAGASGEGGQSPELLKLPPESELKLELLKLELLELESKLGVLELLKLLLESKLGVLRPELKLPLVSPNVLVTSGEL